MKIIVQLYGNLSNQEKRDLNVLGIPDEWPFETASIGDTDPIPDGWIVMTEEEIIAQKAANQTAYDAWVASREVPPIPDEDDTSVIQGNNSQVFVPIMTRYPRRGLYAVFFNANAIAKNVTYKIYIDENPVDDSERIASFKVPTSTTLSTHAEVYVLDGSNISVRYITDGSSVTISKRSIMLIQKDAG